MCSALYEALAWQRLNPPAPYLSESEEDRCPWQVSNFEPFQKPLLRTWDYFSGSKPESDGRMLARAPGRYLDDEKSRRENLSIHVCHGTWEPTPFISFTDSDSALKDMIEYRMGRHRGSQTVTVIDPNVRLRRGMPVISIRKTMEYYKVRSPYQSDYYYDNHWICLWEVAADEIVGHWKWNDLVRCENWYDKIVLPAFEKFSQEKQTSMMNSSSSSPSQELGPGPFADDSIEGLQSALSKLHVTLERSTGARKRVYVRFDDSDDDTGEEAGEADPEPVCSGVLDQVHRETLVLV